MLEYSNTFSFLAPSECKQYKFLNDSDRHSDFGRGDRKCDKNLTEDWYRFSAGAGTSIPTLCLPHHRCGTDMPGWMDGAHPTVDEGVVSLWSTYGIAGLSLYTDLNRSKIVPAGTVEKVRGWNSNLVFKDTVYHYTLTFSRLFNPPLN